MIRPYQPTDKKHLLALLKSNTPQYFDPSEEGDFMDYLDNKLEDYFVVEKGRKIIGSGGVNYFPKTKTARISWDIIHPDFQGKGIGKELTLFRVNHIKSNPAIDFIVVRTSQLAFQFYEKVGFNLEKIEKDYWADGFDLYLMKLEILDRGI